MFRRFVKKYVFHSLALSIILLVCAQAQIPSHQSLVDSERIALDAAASHASGGMSSVQEGLNSGRLSDVLLVVKFPAGNPFPDKQLPDLHVIDTSHPANLVSPIAAGSTEEYAVYRMILPPGAQYTLQWLFYLGGKQDWGWLIVPANAGREYKAEITYNVVGKASPSAGKPCNPKLPNYEQKGCIH